MSDYKNLIKKNNNIFYMAKGMEIFFYDPPTDIMIGSCRATLETNFEYTIEMTPHKGGLKGLPLFSTKNDETLKFTTNSLSFSPEFYALQSGNKLQFGEFEIVALPHKVKVVEANGVQKITLPHVPVGKHFHVFYNGKATPINVVENETEYDITPLGIQEECVEVGYAYKAPATRATIGGGNPKIVKTVGINHVFRSDGSIYATHAWTIPNMQLDGSFTETFNGANGDPSTFTISGVAQAIDSGNCLEEGTALGYVDIAYTDENEAYSVTDIIPAPSNVELRVGEFKDLTVDGDKGILSESFDITQRCIFTSANPAKATVDNAGKITAVEVTDTPVEITVEYQGIKKTVSVTVIAA